MKGQLSTGASSKLSANGIGERDRAHPGERTGRAGVISSAVRRLLPAALLLPALALGQALPGDPAVAGGASPAPQLVRGEVRTARFRILYTEKSAGVARALGEKIERARDDFRHTLGRDWPGVTEVRVGLGRGELEALAIPGGEPPPWAAALAYPDQDILLFDGMTLNGPDGFEMLRHELSHVALGRLGRDWPRWFQEGLAMHLSGERSSVSLYAALFRAVHQDRVYPFRDLARRWPDRPEDVEIAYAQSEAFVAFLIGRYGPDGLGKLIDEERAGAPFELAFARAFKTTVDLEEIAFRERLPARYAWLPFTFTSSFVWLAAAALCVLGYVRVRRDKALHLAQMEAEEAAEAAALRIIQAEAGAAGEATPGEPEAAPGESEPGAGAPPTPTIH